MQFGRVLRFVVKAVAALGALLGGAAGVTTACSANKDAPLGDARPAQTGNTSERGVTININPVISAASIQVNPSIAAPSVQANPVIIGQTTYGPSNVQVDNTGTNNVLLRSPDVGKGGIAPKAKDSGGRSEMTNTKTALPKAEVTAPPSPEKSGQATGQVTSCEGLDVAQWDNWPASCRDKFQKSEHESTDREVEILRRRSGHS